MSQTVLLIDDSAVDRLLYQRFLREDKRQSYQIIEFESGEAALDWCQNNQAAVILLDYLLPQMDGLEFLRRLQQQNPNEILPVIFLTGFGKTSVAVEALKLGVQDYLDKDQITEENLTQLVRNVAQQVWLKRKLARQQAQQHILYDIALQMQQFPDPQHALDAATQKIRQFLQADRVLIYQFTPNRDGAIIAESVGSEWPRAIDLQFQDTCFQQGAALGYEQGRIWAMANIEQAELTDCHQALLTQFAVKANLVVPILQKISTPVDLQVSSPLWGLLIAHHCQAPHEWQADEITLMQQVSVQLSSAIQQAAFYQQAQRELSERKQAETALAESELCLRLAQSQLQAILDNSEVVVYLKDRTGRYLLINRQYEMLTQLSREVVVGGTDFNVYPAEVAQRLQQNDQEVLSTGKHLQFEETVPLSEGDRTYLALKFPLYDMNGHIYAVCGMSTDITELKRTQELLRQRNQELQVLNQDLERANAAKDAFLRMMNHELRTPLTPILGIAEGLREGAFGPLNDRQKQAIATIAQKGDHLLALINDILNLVDLESGNISLNRQTVTVQSLCEASVGLILPQSEAKSIQLHTQISLDIDRIQVDPDRMQQVLTHLLENAVKFTPNGGTVILTVKPVLGAPSHDANEAALIEFSVQDSGIGIAPENLRKLFQFFTQIDDGLNRSYEGVGIGLALVQRLVELHNGQVTVKSRLWQGSCFTVTLPDAATS